jgi:hypothetical protein
MIDFLYQMMGYSRDARDNNETITLHTDPPPHPHSHPPGPHHPVPDGPDPVPPDNPDDYRNHTYTYQDTVAGEMLWVFLFLCMARFIFEMYIVCKEVSNNMSSHYRKTRIKSILLTTRDMEENLLNQCSICLEDFVVGESVNILTCSHGFHEACLKEWIPHNLTCPICRQTIGNRSTDNLRSDITDEENSG